MHTADKPYSESCEQNQEPILSIIEPLLIDCKSVLEIGSGTGQHAVYFAEKLPHLIWHTSDQPEYIPGIAMWLHDARLKNTRMPVELDVSRNAWPDIEADAVFSANTCHIMHWHDVEALFAGVGRLLSSGGKFLLYGPFNYGGDYTSESNARFDGWLKSRDPSSGVRDFEALQQLAEKNELNLREDYAMPANNRILYWQKA